MYKRSKQSNKELSLNIKLWKKRKCSGSEDRSRESKEKGEQTLCDQENTLPEAERRAEMKGLASEAGLIGPPVSTPAITSKESGQAKGRKDPGLPKMLPSRAPLDLGLSPDLGRVSGMLEEVPDDGKLATVFQRWRWGEMCRRERCWLQQRL